MVEGHVSLPQWLAGIAANHNVIQSREDYWQVNINREDLPQAVKGIQANDGRLLTMVGNDERDVEGEFALYYVFGLDREQKILSVRVGVDAQDPHFPSLVKERPAYDWYEREVHDLLGLIPEDHPHLAPLIWHEGQPQGIYPLRKDAEKGYVAQQQVTPQNGYNNESTTVLSPFTRYTGEGITQVPVGPIHAGIIEPGHFRFGVIGDTVLQLDAQLFYKHRGIEKAAEGLTLSKALQLAERTCGACALSHGVAFAQAVERLGNIAVPRRAQLLRTLFLELERLYNHIGDVGNMCAGTGFQFGVQHGARLKEALMRLNFELVGHRFLRNIVTIGGIKQDLDPNKEKYLRTTLEKIREEFAQLVEIIMNHEITMDRMKTTGKITRELANQLEVVGPAARAAGREVDIRRSHPYLVYDELNFNVIRYDEGDVWARFRVRVDEAFQSFLLIDQVLNRLPQGGLQAALGQLPAFRGEVGWCESPRGELVHWLMLGPDQTVYRWRVRSAAYSNWPAVSHAVPGNIVPDFPLINKSFQLCYACCDR